MKGRIKLQKEGKRAKLFGRGLGFNAIGHFFLDHDGHGDKRVEAKFFENRGCDVIGKISDDFIGVRREFEGEKENRLQ